MSNSKKSTARKVMSTEEYVKAYSSAKTKKEREAVTRKFQKVKDAEINKWVRNTTFK